MSPSDLSPHGFPELPKVIASTIALSFFYPDFEFAQADFLILIRMIWIC